MLGSRFKILVVDDDRDYARLLVDCFTGLGFEVVYVDNGRAALVEVERQRPDIVLLDILMPGLDGFEVCRQVRQSPDNANLIVMMLTSQAEVEDRIKGIDIGADDYVVKPFGLSELFEVVARVNRLLDTKNRYLRRVEEEKYNTLRGAANTVCHEINNPLTAIVGSARTLAKRSQDCPELQELRQEAENILEASLRIRRITQQLARAIRVVTREPIPGITMIDLEASSQEK